MIVVNGLYIYIYIYIYYIISYFINITHIHTYFTISQQGNVKASQSETSPFFIRKRGEYGTLKRQKRLQEGIENPTFVIDTPETSASKMQESLSVNTHKEDENKTTERLPFRLIFSQDKKQDLSHTNHSCKDVMLTI